MREPRIFLFDEPLSNLDAELRVSMRTEITSLHERLAATMIYVTHDQVEAMTMADKIVVLRAGRIEQVGAPLELYNRPANRFVAGFIGSPQMNFLPVTVAGRDARRRRGDVTRRADVAGAVAARTAPAAGTALTLGVRPEHLALPTSAADTQLSVTVLHLEQLGAHSLLHGVVTDGETRVTVHVAGQTRVRAGDTVGVTHRGRRCAPFRRRRRGSRDLGPSAMHPLRIAQIIEADERPRAVRARARLALRSLAADRRRGSRAVASARRTARAPDVDDRAVPPATTYRGRAARERRSSTAPPPRRSRPVDGGRHADDATACARRCGSPRSA